MYSYLRLIKHLMSWRVLHLDVATWIVTQNFSPATKAGILENLQKS